MSDAHTHTIPDVPSPEVEIPPLEFQSDRISAAICSAIDSAVMLRQHGTREQYHRAMQQARHRQGDAGMAHAHNRSHPALGKCD